MRPGIAALIAALLLVAPPASAFCVVNETDRPLDIESGGAPMPTDVRYGLKSGERHCYVPRRPGGIMVEIWEQPNAAPKRLKCRLSVPGGKAEIRVGDQCRVKVD